jgi:hypothetical protein
MLSACGRARSWIGHKYDFMFSGKNKAKYCVEIPVESYKEEVPRYRPKHSVLAGEKTYTPDDLFLDTANWKVVLNSIDHYRE